MQKPEEKTDTTARRDDHRRDGSRRPEAVAEEAEKGYSLMIIGLEKTVARRNEFHEDITKLAAGFEGPLAVLDVRDKLLEHPLERQAQYPRAGQRHRVFAPRSGSRNRGGARDPRATDRALCRAAAAGKRSRRYEEAILKDISKLAETYDTECARRCVPNVAAEDAILKELVTQAIQSGGDWRRPPTG